MDISHFYEFMCDQTGTDKTIVVPDAAIDVIFRCGPEAPYTFRRLLRCEDYSERIIQK